MKRSATPSFLFQRFVRPTVALCAVAALTALISFFSLLFSLAIPSFLVKAIILVQFCLAGSITWIFFRNQKTMRQFDQLLGDICAQGIAATHALPYDPNDHDLWDNFDNLFQSYLSNVNHDYASELLVRQAQFSTLQSQINPHFLYNTLESLRGHATETGADDIADMAEALSHFFRYSISRTGDFVTVRQELDSISNYFHIQRYRFGNGLLLQITADPSDDLSAYYMPKLTLQPLVENSIAHGFADSPTSGLVTVQVIVSQSRLIMAVEDNGAGMDAATLSALRTKVEKVIPPQRTPNVPPNGGTTRSGLGLNNVNQRIKLFFGQDYGLFITSTPKMGTTIQLELPLLDDPNQVAAIT